LQKQPKSGKITRYKNKKMPLFKENRLVFKAPQQKGKSVEVPKEGSGESKESSFQEERRSLLLDTIAENIEKKDILKEAGKSRAEQIELVTTIDLDKTEKEQQSNIDTMEGFLLTGLPKLFEAGIKIEKLTDVPTAIEQINEKTAEKLDPYGEIQSMIVLRKIASNPSCKLGTSWEFEKKILPKIKEDYERAVKLRDTKVEDVKEEEPKDFFGKMIKWIKDNKKAVIGAVALAGAIGAGVYVYKKIKNKTDSNLIKFGATGLSAISTGLVLGSILGTDGWKEWINEKLGTNFALTNILEAIPYLFKGEFVKAWEILRRGEVEIDPVSKLIAKRLDIDAEKVALLRDQDLDKFMSKGNELLTKTIETGTEIGTSILSVISPSKEQTFIGENLEEKDKLVKAEKALIEYFKRPDIEKAISEMSPKPKTIGELLDELSRQGYLNTAGVAAAPRTPDESKDSKEKPEDQELGIFVDGGSWERFKDLGTDHFPKTAEHLGSFIESPGKSLISMDFYSGLITSVKEDGGALMSIGGILYLVKDGYTFFALGSSEIILNSLKELGEAFMFEDESYLDAGKSWVKDSMGFVVIMSAFRITTGLAEAIYNNIKHSEAGKQRPIIRSIGRGALQGTLEGIAMPVTVVKAHVFGGQASYRFIKDTKLGRDIAAADEALKTLTRNGISTESDQFRSAVETASSAKMQRLRFYAEIYKKYNDIYEQTRGLSLSNPGKKAWAEANLARIESLRKSYALKFSKLYGEMHQAGLLPEEFEAINEDMSKENPSKVKTHTEKIIELARQKEAQARETRITERTQEIRKLRKSGKLNESGIKGLSNINTDEILESRGIDPNSTRAEAYLEEWDKRMAEQMETGRSVNPRLDFKFEGAKPSIELRIGKSGQMTARYLGTEIPMEGIKESAITNPTLAELADVRAQCEAKWKLTAEALTQADYVYKNGKFELTLNGQELPEGILDGADSIEAATKRYVQALEDGGMEVPKDFVRNMAKYGTCIPQLEIALGTAGAAFMLYEIETAEDKKATLIKQMTLLGTGLYAAGKFEKKWGYKIKNPWLNFFGALLAGIIGATLGDKMIEPIVQEITPNIPGINGISLELGEILSRYVGYKFTIKPAIELASRKGLTRGIERQLARYMERTVMKESTNKGIRAAIKRIVTSQVIKRVIIAAVGPKRAAAILACFADDVVGFSPYAPVAIITDIVGAGMLIWSGWDIYQAIAVYMNAVKLDKELTARDGLKIKEDSIRIMEPEVIEEIEEKGISLGDLSQNEQAFFDFLARQPKVTIEMGREGRVGLERWTFENGVATGIEIWNGKEKIASITGMDAEMMEEGAHEIERQHPELTSSGGGDLLSETDTAGNKQVEKMAA